VFGIVVSVMLSAILWIYLCVILRVVSMWLP
jgi:hypothetical protein